MSGDRPDARELALADEHAALDAAAFAPLPAAAAILRGHVRRKLAIARPGYDATEPPSTG